MTVETVSGAITASESALNTLAVYLMRAGEDYARSGYSVLSGDARKTAGQIVDALEASGFYDKFSK